MAAPLTRTRWQRGRRWLARGAVAVVIALVAVAAWDTATYDAKTWLADYGRLKQTMAQGYANLDWVAQQRRVDLVALDRRTTTALTNAHSRVRAYFALRDFLGAFRDPHLRLEPRQAPSPAYAGSTQASLAAAPAEPAVSSCQSAGYEEGEHGFQFPYATLPAWQAVEGGDFPTGVIGDVGVLRIAQFGENQYRQRCESVFVPGLDARALQLRVRAGLQQQLQQRLSNLRARGARQLLVDVTGNGGGSEWVSEVTALMTARELSREAPRIVGPACDRAGVWRGERVCPVFAPASTRDSLAGTGAWQGPVIILTDHDTASASEDFVAWLQQNGVATVIGEPTLGAGCGYMDGGVRAPLTQLPLDVAMPNCARFLADGRNEIEGLRPDVPLALGDAEAPQKLAAWLQTAKPKN